MPSNGTLGGIRTHDPCLRRPRDIFRVYKMGINPKTVAERLGHSSVVITRDTYSHLTPGMQEAAAVQFDAVMGGGRVKSSKRSDNMFGSKSNGLPTWRIGLGC